MSKRSTAIAVSVCLVFFFALGFLVVQLVWPTTLSDASQGVTPTWQARGTSRGTLPPTWTPTFTPSPTSTREPTPTVTSTPTVTPSPTVTPTPLPPLRPTAVDVTLTVTPEITETYAIPTAVPRFPIPEEAITVVLLGSDKRPEWTHWNTDAIQYVVIYPDIPSVAVLSIPRDLYVYLPGFGLQRINVADMYGTVYHYEGGGHGLLNQTLLYNLGITADYYAKVDFNGLVTLVDALGGIEVPVHCRVEDYWPFPDEEGEYYHIAVEPGMRHMDGQLALWYSRTRKTTSVFAREARQQQVLEAMWRAAKQAQLLYIIPDLYRQYIQYVETDLGIGNLLQLGLVAAQLQPSDVRLYNIGRAQVEPYVTPGGGGVFLPVWDEIATVIERALLPPASSRAVRASVLVEVWNGTHNEDWDLLAVDRLSREGFAAYVGEPDRRDYPHTQIHVFSDVVKGTGLPTVQRLFGVPDGRVSYYSGGSETAVLRVILGQDYVTCP